MCFSAAASFTTSGALLVVGAGSLVKAPMPSHTMLASIPLIFGVQQFSEGVLWLTIGKPNSVFIQKIAANTFIFFGQNFWPVWIPLALLFLEKDGRRRKIFCVLFGLGILMSVFLTYEQIVHEVNPLVINNHIHYAFDYPHSFVDTYSMIYLIPTVLSNFVSSIRKVQILGILTLMAFIFSRVFFFQFVFSIWCFFTAVLSLFIFFIIKEAKP